MILFRCDSVYQLMNAIQIKMTLLKDESADLLLSDHTNFDPLIPAYRKAGSLKKSKDFIQRKNQMNTGLIQKKNEKISADIHRNMWI